VDLVAAAVPFGETLIAAERPFFSEAHNNIVKQKLQTNTEKNSQNIHRKKIPKNINV
jgi:hypothetical protein